MRATVADVLVGQARYSCVQSDAIDFFHSLPDDSIDLLFTSPPYLKARSYSTDGISRTLDEWVPWMFDVICAAAPKVKGLIAVNCEGQTRNYVYQPAPFLLMVRLYEEGYNLRKPIVFHRIGIPGSGGPDWLRNDWEPIICVTREGRLPWSDPTACSQSPKYKPGGAMSYRRTDGRRKNARDKAETIEKRKAMKDLQATGLSQRDAPRHVGLPLKKGSSTATKDDLIYDATYIPPDVVNPGNVLKFNVGGGHLGHPLAHENEAPFPFELAEFFVKSFCPPNGIVSDPFSGSGTVCHAAFAHGRRFIGCDLRDSQVELCHRRLATVTPPLFNDLE